MEKKISIISLIICICGFIKALILQFYPFLRLYILNVVIVILSTVAILVILIPLFPNYISQFNIVSNMVHLGYLGDYIGAIITSMFTLLGFFFFI